MLGLYAFFYGLVHLSSFVSFDHVFEVAEIVKDIFKRPFITVGFTALVLLVPLAVTSTDRMVRRLGAKRWLALHQLVYVIAPLGVLHFWWMVKADLTEPAIYAAIVAGLLGYRVVAKLKESRRRARGAARGGDSAAARKWLSVVERRPVGAGRASLQPARARRSRRNGRAMSRVSTSE